MWTAIDFPPHIFAKIYILRYPILFLSRECLHRRKLWQFSSRTGIRPDYLEERRLPGWFDLIPEKKLEWEVKCQTHARVLKVNSLIGTKKGERKERSDWREKKKKRPIKKCANFLCDRQINPDPPSIRPVESKFCFILLCSAAVSAQCSLLSLMPLWGDRISIFI